MDRAFNLRTKEFVDAFEIFENGAYQNLNPKEWIIPRDSIISQYITNWDSEEMKLINEVPVYHVHEHVRKLKNGKEKVWRPHFSKYPNSPANTKPESKEHKILKDWIFKNVRYKKCINIKYSTATKKYRYNVIESIDKLDIDWNKYSVEVPVRGRKNLQADILLPFKRKHPHLGFGIFIEVQLSKQNKEKTYDRTLDRAIMGYSTIFLFEKDFEIFDWDNCEIELKDNNMKLYSYQSELKYCGKKFCKELKETVQEEITYIEKERKKLQKVKEEIVNSVCESVDKLQNTANELKNKNKESINIYIINKIKELGKEFENKIISSVQKDFFNNNIEEIREIITELTIPLFKEYMINEIRSDKEEIKQGIISSINYKSIEKEIEKKLSSVKCFQQLIINPPKCCGRDKKFISKTTSFVCEVCNTWSNIPNNIQKIINGDAYETD